MTDAPLTAQVLTNRAIESANNGELGDARTLLAEALTRDPSYRLAWLWYAHVADSDGERKFCLQQAKALKDDPSLAADLQRLIKVEAERPNALRELVDPEPPPHLGPITAGKRPGFDWWWILGVVAAVAFAAVALWYFAPEERQTGEPVYVAFVSGFTDEPGDISTEMERVAQLSWDTINARGGINGHPVQMLVYDDDDDPAKAEEIAKQIVAEDKVLAVIGHGSSAACAAAGPIYQAAEILVISSVCTIDSITRDNDWFFRSTYDNHYQGMGIAAYLDDILDAQDVLLLVSDDIDSINLADNIEKFSDGVNLTRLPIADTTGRGLLGVVDEIKRITDRNTILVFATQDDIAEQLVIAMRNRGITNQVLGGDNLGSQAFLNRFSDMPQEQLSPGYYSDGIIAAAPMVVDSLSGNALQALRIYRARFGTDPDWQAATTYDATYAIRDAMARSGITGLPENRIEERHAIRDAIDAMDTPATASNGVLGQILFDKDGTMPRYPVFGIASGGTYVSAPVQLHPYAPVSATSLQADLASGKAFVVDNVVMQRQQIVFTGINFNEVSDLDLGNPSFYADFFIWFTYAGDESATNIVFQNAVNPSLALGDPIRESATPDGLTYRLYRVTGRFKAPLEFQDFPFDVQDLVVVFQNKTMPSSELVYAIDQSLLQTPQEVRLASGIDVTASINQIPNWLATSVDFYQETIGSSSFMGDPTANSARGVHFSLMASDITIERDIKPFLIKNLLPLALLVLVTYVSLYFPHSRTGARVSFGITGILTGAVMLNNVTNSLPDVGYTVAIEWLFYAFILLSACCIIIGLVGDYLWDQRNLVTLRRLDLFSHVFFITFVVSVVMVYVARFDLVAG